MNTSRLAHLRLSKHRDVKVVGHGAITSVSIDPLEWRYILVGSSDGLIAIYDSRNISAGGSSKHVSKMVGITSKASAESRSASTSVVQWYPSDNGLFVSSSANGQLKVWDANVLSQPVESFLLSQKIYSHDISPLNPSCVAVATDTNHVRIVDLRAGSSTHELRGHQRSLLTVKWSPNLSSILASGCLGGKLLLWDVRKARNCLMNFDFANLKAGTQGRKMCTPTSATSAKAHKGT